MYTTDRALQLLRLLLRGSTPRDTHAAFAAHAEPQLESRMLRLPSCHLWHCSRTRGRPLPRGPGRAAPASDGRVLPLPVPGGPARVLSQQQRLVARAKAEDDGDDDEGPAVPGKALRVERLLANLGFGRRKECQSMIKRGLVVRQQDGSRVRIGDKVTAADILVDGEAIDDPFPLAIVVNKPVGYVVTSPDDERVLDPTVYDLLPYR
jgi:hypothetical protein